MSERDIRGICLLIGLMQKSGRLVGGEDGVLNAIRSGKAAYVLVAGDASGNTRKRITDKCAYYGVTCSIFGTGRMLGEATGKENRKVLAVTDRGFAESLAKKLAEAEGR